MKNKKQRSSQKKVQINFFIITVTDVLTWVPFCSLNWAFTNEASIDKENIYQISAVIILPINSITNPLIYHGVHRKLKEAIRFMASGCKENNTSRNASATATTRTRKITFKSDINKDKSGIGNSSRLDSNLTGEQAVVMSDFRQNDLYRLSKKRIIVNHTCWGV